jgi:hypothetical protein
LRWQSFLFCFSSFSSSTTANFLDSFKQQIFNELGWDPPASGGGGEYPAAAWTLPRCRRRARSRWCRRS